VIGAATGSLVTGTQIATQSLFDHLSDQRFGTEDDALHTAFAGSNPAQAAFAGDMAALNDLVACLPQALAKNGGWFRGLGGFGNIDSSNGAPGVDSYGGGFMAGYDRALTDNFLVGIAAGYTHTEIADDDGSNAAIDTPRVSLYGSYHLGGFALDSSIGYAFDRIKTDDQSDGGDAKSKRDANEISAALQASYNVNLPDAVVLTPHAGLDYLHIFEDGFNEHGAGAFDLQADSNNTDSLRPQIGAGISRSFATDNGWHLIPAVDVTYSREVLDNNHDANVSAGGGTFNVKGVTPSRDQLALNVDLTAQLNDSVDLSLGYTDILPVGNTASYNFIGGVHVLF
jgi:outer membrane autotransporter protein